MAKRMVAYKISYHLAYGTALETRWARNKITGVTAQGVAQTSAWN